MIDFKNVITDFDLTVWKAVYYINKEQKNNNDIFPKYRTITSFMRCNEKSDHYEFYKKHPNVFGKFERFSSDSVQESLSKLVNLKKLRKEGDCYYSVSSPLKVALTCYGKMKLTHANFTRGFQSICFEKASNLEEVLDEEKYEILSNELLILKIYLKNDNCYIMIGDVEYKLSFRPIVYNELKIKVKERIEEINKQVARKRKAIQKKTEETVVKVTVEKKPKKESATKKTIKKEKKPTTLSTKTLTFAMYKEEMKKTMLEKFKNVDVEKMELFMNENLDIIAYHFRKGTNVIELWNLLLKNQKRISN